MKERRGEEGRREEGRREGGREEREVETSLSDIVELSCSNSIRSRTKANDQMQNVPVFLTNKEVKCTCLSDKQTG